MSDRFPGEIWIGGKLAGSLAAPLCKMIREQQVSLEWGENTFEPQSAEDLLFARQEFDNSEVLRLCDCEATFGAFHDLEQFLTANGIPFTRQSDGKYEYDAQRVDYRPGYPPREQLTDHAGNPVVLVTPVRRVAAKLARIDRELAAGNIDEAKLIIRDTRYELRAELPARLPSLPSLEFVSDEPVHQSPERQEIWRSQ